jgi:hypothetical protein
LGMPYRKVTRPASRLMRPNGVLRSSPFAACLLSILLGAASAAHSRCSDGEP